MPAIDFSTMTPRRYQFGLMMLKATVFQWALTVVLSPAWAIPHRSSAPSNVGIPVYLKPTSPVPTGHYSLETLNRQKITSQKSVWVHVKTTEGLIGWTPKEALLTPLHFSSKATLLAQSPLYPEKELQNSAAPMVSQKEGIVTILEVVGDRCLVRVGDANFWTESAYLYPVAKDAGYFITVRMTSLYGQPSIKSQWSRKLTAGQRLKPIEIKGDWVKVSYQTYTGFIPRKDILSRIDIAMKVKTSEGMVAPQRSLLDKKVYAIYVNPLWLGTMADEVSLFQEPSTSSEVITQLKPWTPMIQQNMVEQTWTQSQIRELGPVWWQSKDIPTTIPSSLEIAQKDIQKSLVNPLFNHIRFASTFGAMEGLYRTQDGKNWFPIRGFSQRSPVFTVSKDGVLFVDDKVSFDNGEHFTPYVHWGAIFEALKRHRLSTVQNTKIRNIETLNGSSQQLIVELDVGLKNPLKLYTADRGQSWTVLNR